MGCVASKDARDERGATYKAGVERGSLDAPGRRRATRSDDEKAKNDDDDDDGAKTRATPPPIPPPAVDARAEKARRARAKKKRVAIAVEALASDASITKVPKDKASTKLILNAVERNILFDGLNEETRLVLASTMTRAVAAAGQDIISQGDDDASHFYVLASGAATVHVRRAREAETDDDDAGARDDDDDAGDAGDDENVSNSEKDGRDESESENANAPAADEEETRVGSYVAGDSFGELALLYSCPRAATVRATEECALWQLERRVYVNVKRSYQERLQRRKRALVESCELLAPLGEENKATLADALRPVTYDKGDAIIRRGDVGDRFYVLASGEVSIKNDRGDVIGAVKEGGSFGEKALVNDDVRKADVVVASDHAECFYLDRDKFNELLGSYDEMWRWLTLRRVPMLATVSDAELNEITACLSKPKAFAAGSVVFDVGDPGDSMYVVERGVVVVTDANDRVVARAKDGDVVGERSLMGSERRALRATVNVDANAPASLLELRRGDLERILGDGLREVTTRARLACLSHVTLLRSLNDDQRTKLVPFLTPRQYDEGDVVFREGERGDRFYIVETGNVAIHRARKGGGKKTHREETLKLVTRGEYFGELALLRGDPRAASATVEKGGAFVLSLSRDDFVEHLGPLQEILDRDAVNEYGVTPSKKGQGGGSGGSRGGNGGKRSLDVSSMSDFSVKAVLGVGAFGKVFLATREDEVYAVKSLSKAQILGAQLQHHVMQERDVMKDCDSPFTVRLVATFQDRAMLYMCMETVMGGELFNHLARVGGALHEDTARFYAACVVLAFQYLQAKHYVYRDLKPENLLIDRNGFLKIADFGFAKRLLPGEKTYTLCGTPEYMSPELYKQSGHNKGVDWWALGVLIYEMVVGAPPFYSPGGDGETQWRRILVAKYSFPSGVTPHFKDIVRRLLTVNSVQRLGCLKGGVKDVKLHPWLRSVDWVSLAQRTHAAPFVPPISGDDDPGCFDPYDLDVEHPGEEFLRGKGGRNGGVSRRGDEFFSGF